MIHVIYRNGTDDFVTAKFLDILLFMNEVQMFRRKEGWVTVETDPLRGTTTNGIDTPLHGINRRHHQSSLTQLPESILCLH